jgi:hypothetical protein
MIEITYKIYGKLRTKVLEDREYYDWLDYYAPEQLINMFEVLEVIELDDELT